MQPPITVAANVLEKLKFSKFTTLSITTKSLQLSPSLFFLNKKFKFLKEKIKFLPGQLSTVQQHDDQLNLAAVPKGCSRCQDFGWEPGPKVQIHTGHWAWMLAQHQDEGGPDSDSSGHHPLETSGSQRKTLETLLHQFFFFLSHNSESGKKFLIKWMKFNHWNWIRNNGIQSLIYSTKNSNRTSMHSGMVNLKIKIKMLAQHKWASWLKQVNWQTGMQMSSID